jgi:hypothetical protein
MEMIGESDASLTIASVAGFGTRLESMGFDPIS